LSAELWGKDLFRDRKSRLKGGCSQDWLPHICRLVCCVLLVVASAFCAPPPVILISIDTLRADHLSAYGYGKIKTPNIDSFAQDGTLFGNIEAQIPLTLPSHTSLFTSTYPFENQIEENAEHVPSGMATLASVLKSRGYQTAAFIGSVFLERQMGLDAGFDFYDSPFQFEAFSPMSGSMFFGGAGQNPYGVRDRRDGALVVGAASRWLHAHTGQPAFVFIHLFDLHKPYKLADYDAEILYVDHLLGVLKTSFGPSWNKSLVAVFSDHGEGLGDHGEASHGYFIYESTLRVPLLVHWPAGSPQYPAHIDQPGGLIDVAPTLLDVLHIPPPPSFEGKSMLPGADGPRFVYAETVHEHDAFGWAPLRSLRVGSLKYIDAPKPELYDLAGDPHETNNLVRRESAKVTDLQATLKKLLIRYAPKRPASPGELSPATRALLGSLGYLAGGPRTGVEKGPDPKDKLPEFQLYERSQLALYNRHLDEAVALLSKLLAGDPNNLLARRDLGSVYLDQKQYRKAQECLAKVVASSANDYAAQYELGIADKELGLTSEALAHLEAACKIAPGAAQCKSQLDALRKPAGSQR
jgi:arylsulfatase A-like enzyme